MANNYSAGTVETNFNLDQQNHFQLMYASYIEFQYDMVKHTTLKDAELSILKDLDGMETSSENLNDFDYTTLDSDDSGDFWDMTAFDWHAVEYAVEQTFKRFPNSKLTAEAGVAFHCSKPRMGEFGGQQESWKQDE